MGTRNLTCVFINKEPKIAQYGQWDGYPSGQGSTALAFLHTADLDKFKKAVSNCSFITDKELSQKWNEVGSTDGYATLSQSDAFRAKSPQLDRDMGAEVLQYVYDHNGAQLTNSIDFSGDSLFCEWAYVIDLDENVFEIYRGFNKTPVPADNRFASYFSLKDKEDREQWHPIALIKSYPLNNLPSEEAFLEDFNENEEDEEE